MEDTKKELERFKKRLIRTVIRLHSEGHKERVFWKLVEKTMGRPCRGLWGHMRMVMLKKLTALLEAGDNMEFVAPVARMLPMDWLLLDFVLIHEDVHVISQNAMQKYGELLPLVQMFHLVQLFQLEQAPRDQLARCWSDACLHYKKDGRESTPMLLQRRWWELKSVTRASFYDYHARIWERSRLPGFDPSEEEDKPPALCVAIARRYPHVVTETLQPWRDLINTGHVVRPEEFVALNQRPPDSTTDQNTIPPDETDDIIMVEPVIETITLDGEDDLDDEEMEVRHILKQQHQILTTESYLDTMYMSIQEHPEVITKQSDNIKVRGNQETLENTIYTTGENTAENNIATENQLGTENDFSTENTENTSAYARTNFAINESKPIKTLILNKNTLEQVSESLAREAFLERQPVVTKKDRKQEKNTKKWQMRRLVRQHLRFDKLYKNCKPETTPNTHDEPSTSSNTRIDLTTVNSKHENEFLYESLGICNRAGNALNSNITSKNKDIIQVDSRSIEKHKGIAYNKKAIEPRSVEDRITESGKRIKFNVKPAVNYKPRLTNLPYKETQKTPQLSREERAIDTRIEQNIREISTQENVLRETLISPKQSQCTNIKLEKTLEREVIYGETQELGKTLASDKANEIPAVYTFVPMLEESLKREIEHCRNKIVLENILGIKPDSVEPLLTTAVGPTETSSILIPNLPSVKTEATLRDVSEEESIEKHHVDEKLLLIPSVDIRKLEHMTSLRDFDFTTTLQLNSELIEAVLDESRVHPPQMFRGFPTNNDSSMEAETMEHLQERLSLLFEKIYQKKVEYVQSNPLNSVVNDALSFEHPGEKQIGKNSLSKRIYTPIAICKNPDFNTRLRRLTAGFLMIPQNREYLQMIKPLTIDIIGRCDDNTKTIESETLESCPDIDIIDLIETGDEENFILEKKIFSREDRPKPKRFKTVKNILFQPNTETITEKRKSTEEDQTARKSKPIELPDIDDVRRINKNMLTAEVTPVQTGSIRGRRNEKFTLKMSSSGEFLIATSKRNPVFLEPVVAKLPMVSSTSGVNQPWWCRVSNPPSQQACMTTETFDKLVDSLIGKKNKKPPLMKYCCLARKHMSLNQARNRLALKRTKYKYPMTKLDIHMHKDSVPCQCCCKAFLEPQKYEDKVENELEVNQDILEEGAGDATSKAEMTETADKEEEPMELVDITEDDKEEKKRKNLERRREECRRKNHERRMWRLEKQKKEVEEKILREYEEWVKERNQVEKFGFKVAKNCDCGPIHSFSCPYKPTKTILPPPPVLKTKEQPMHVQPDMEANKVEISLSEDKTVPNPITCFKNPQNAILNHNNQTPVEQPEEEAQAIKDAADIYILRLDEGVRPVQFADCKLLVTNADVEFGNGKETYWRLPREGTQCVQLQLEDTCTPSTLKSLKGCLDPLSYTSMTEHFGVPVYSRVRVGAVPASEGVLSTGEISTESKSGPESHRSMPIIDSMDLIIAEQESQGKAIKKISGTSLNDHQGITHIDIDSSPEGSPAPNIISGHIRNPSVAENQYINDTKNIDDCIPKPVPSSRVTHPHVLVVNKIRLQKICNDPLYYMQVLTPIRNVTVIKTLQEMNADMFLYYAGTGSLMPLSKLKPLVMEALQESVEDVTHSTSPSEVSQIPVVTNVISFGVDNSEIPQSHSSDTVVLSSSDSDEEYIPSPRIKTRPTASNQMEDRSLNTKLRKAPLRTYSNKCKTQMKSLQVVRQRGRLMLRIQPNEPKVLNAMLGTARETETAGPQQGGILKLLLDTSGSRLDPSGSESICNNGATFQPELLEESQEADVDGEPMEVSDDECILGV